MKKDRTCERFFAELNACFVILLYCMKLTKWVKS